MRARTVVLLAGLVATQHAAYADLDKGGAQPPGVRTLTAAEQAMGTPSARAAIRSISSIAACRGPKGDYETRMVSDRGGNLTFRQFFTDRRNVAGILDGRGWQLGADGRSEWIDEVETAVLRGHEFPLVALDLRKRFHDFSPATAAEFEGRPATRIDMTDARGQPASAYFSVASHLPLAIIGTSPRSGATVTTRFDAWRSVANVKLVSHVTILIGSETWVFDFTSLQINEASGEAFKIPRAVQSQPSG